MRIREIHIENFRSLYNLSISFRDFNVFIGRNNSGKSSIFTAIRLIFENLSKLQSKEVMEPVIEQDLGNLPDRIKQQLEKLWFFGNYERPIIISAVIELSKDEIPSELTKDLAEIDGIKIEVRIEWLNNRIIWKVAKMEISGYATSFAKKLNEIHEKTGGEKTYTPYEIVKDGKVLDVNSFKIIIDLLKDGVVYITPYVLPYGIEKSSTMDYFNVEIRGITSPPLISNDLINSIRAVYESPQLRHIFLNYVERVEDIVKPYVSRELAKMYEREQFGFELFGGGDQVVEGLIASIILHSRKRRIFLIEEPEIHLHPDYVRKLAKVLEDLSRELNIQIIITTHSPEFVGALENWNVVSVVRLDRIQTELGPKPVTKVYDLRKRNRITIEQLAQILGISPGIIAFTDVMILVEGKSDEVIFSRYIQILRQNQRLRVLGLYSWRFLDYASRGNLETIIKTLKEFDIFVTVIADGDEEGSRYIRAARNCGLNLNETAFQLREPDILYYVDNNLLVKSLQEIVKPYIGELEDQIKDRINNLINEAKERGLLAREGNRTILRSIVSTLYHNSKQISKLYKDEDEFEHYLKTKIAELSVSEINEVPPEIESIFYTIERQLEIASYM